VKLLFTSIFVLCLSLAAFTQTLDSIFFNLYTDSLKKGTYNYINVVGHYTDSSYLPLSSKEIKFTSTAGTFNGNSLYIDSSFHEEKVTVTATVIRNPAMTQQKDIYIKKYIPNERLPTIDEVMGRGSSDSMDKKRKKRSRRQ
jgi:hypothetical protein